MQNYNSVDLNKVKITDGFWKEKETQNETVTINAVYNVFKDSGRIDAFKCEWIEGKPQKPHIFWDSDVAKWIESVAYITEKKKNEKLEKLADEIIDEIEKNQGEDGYFNIYYTVVEPNNRFTVRNNHELYCAGHLIEAAVAYYLATGKDKLLKCMKKYADYIYKFFLVEKSAAFNSPGHEEIELALIKLYRLTGEKKYLDLCDYFLNVRGRTDEDGVHMHSTYFQDHLPVKEQTTAEGHAVRLCYLCCGMADYAKEAKDEEMFNACKKIFNNIVQRRMYITGGIGSTCYGERFTYDYDLPNAEAYSESCAAISLAMFAYRMGLIDNSPIYAETIERILYNGFLSSTSIDGKAFFYENPLEIDPRKRFENGIEKHIPITQRVELFDCSCCPPNITRFVPQISGYIYKTINDEVFIEQFISSETMFSLGDDRVKLNLNVDLFKNQKMILKIECNNKLIINVRKAKWMENIISNLKYSEQNGYLCFEIYKSSEIKIDFEINVKLNYSNPRVVENAGRVAVSYGPVVYCLEGVDNGPDLKSIVFDKDTKFEIENDSFFNLPIIKATALRPVSTDALYSYDQIKYSKCTVKLIPYFAFANRGECEMLVWVQKKDV